MSSPQVARFAKIIREKLPTYTSVDAAVQALREDIAAMRGDVPAAMESDLLQAQEHVRKIIDDVEILHRNSIIKVREEWYSGPTSDDRHWPALKGLPPEWQGLGSRVRESIDTCSSDRIPTRESGPRPVPLPRPCCGRRTVGQDSQHDCGHRESRGRRVQPGSPSGRHDQQAAGTNTATARRRCRGPTPVAVAVVHDC